MLRPALIFHEVGDHRDGDHFAVVRLDAKIDYKHQRKNRGDATQTENRRKDCIDNPKGHPNNQGLRVVGFDEGTILLVFH